MIDYRALLAKDLPPAGNFPARFAFSIHKCGSSLMNSMIGAVCEKAGIPSLSIPDRLFREGLDDSWARDKALLGLIEEGRVYYGFRYLPPVLLDPEVHLRERKSVLLVRDPRDALVSEYFSYGGKFLSHEKPEKNAEGFREKFDSTKHMEIDEYVVSRSHDLLAKLRYYRAHLDFDNVLLRRYEDIFFDKQTFLAEIFAHFGIEVPADLVALVASLNDVRPDAEDPTRHIRKGTPGDHREKLRPETIAALNEVFRDAARDYGYDLDATTVRELMWRSGVAFGTSGARGLVTAMTDEVCASYVQGFLKVAAREFAFRRVAVGMDLRPSSPRIAAACVQAVRDAGFEPDFCGVLPTPALALHAMSAGIPAIMVTGSHIPFDRNGLKFYRPDGEISKPDELAIAAVALEPIGARAVAPLPAANPQALADYRARYLSFFPAGMLAGMRIGLYEHSSAARDVLREILAGLGADVLSLGRTDQFIPIDTEAVSPEDAARGREWSAAHRLDAIVSTDGDGDRPLLGDETGRWLRGDLLGLLCARQLGLDAVAVPVSCNTAIEASSAFGAVERTRIGSPYVIEAMAALGNARRVGGFEANGGFLLGSRIERDGKVLEPLPTRDAVLPVLAVLAAARAAGVPLSRLLEDLPARYTASDRVQAFPTTRSSALVQVWSARPAALLAELGLGAASIAHADRTDGLRLTTGAGEIVHLRPSGNAPELRCYCEAATPERAAALVATTIQYLSSVKESG